MPRRTRALSQSGGRRRADHRGLHPGSAAVRRGRRRDRRQRQDHLRQYSRDRRLVEGRQGSRPENGGADRSERGARAGRRLRSADQRRRDAHLRQGRTGDRSRQSAERASRRHRADQAARRPVAATGDRLPGGEGHHPAGQGLSRRLRTDGRRLCRAQSVLARRTHVWAGAQRRDVALRHRDRSCPAARRCSRPPICATATCAPIRAIRPRCCARCSRRAI